MKDTYQKALDALIAPQKLQYSSEYLGPKHTIFRGKYVNRRDFDLKN